VAEFLLGCDPNQRVEIFKTKIFKTISSDLRAAQQRLRSAKVCRGDTPPGELCP
jgi:hypothetical protein